MTIAADWRDSMLDERQAKEIKLAEVYTRDFSHGTTGHNQLLLISRLAELLDVAIGAKELPPPPDPADVRLTFGKHNGRTLGELYRLDAGYLEWLARESREEAIRKAAQQVLATPIDDGEDDLL